jgi:tape measure domain-containing protein
MASKIVSLLLSVKNAISPGAKDAADDLRELDKRTVELEKTLSEFDKAQDAVKTLDDTRKAATDAEAAFDSAQLEVEKLKQAFKTEKTPELAVALEKSKIAARDAKKEWQGSTKAVAQLEKVITSAGGDIKNLADTEKKFANELEFANGKLKAHTERVDQVRKSLKNTAQQAVKTTSSIGGTIAKVGAFVSSLVIVDKLKDAFVGLAKSTFDVASQFELLGKRLSPKELGYVTEFARSTPLQLDQVAESFAKLRAFGVDPMNGSLRALVDQNAALGGSYETLTGLVAGVGQAWAKQKLQGEEILQLVERGVPVWDLLAKATGKNTLELQKLSSAGQLGRKEMVLLLAEIAKANEGKAAEAMDTLSGLMSNLKDDITAFYLRVSNNGALDSFKNAIKDVREQIQLMADDGRLEKIASGVATLISSTIEWAGKAAVSLNDNFGKLVGSAQIFSNSIGLVFNGLRAGVTGAVAVVTRAVAELADFAGLDEFAAKARAVSDSFADAFAGASGDVQANLSGIAAATQKLDKSFTELTQSAAKAAADTEATTEAVKRTGEEASKAGDVGAQSLKNMALTLEDTADESDRTAGKIREVAIETEQLAYSADDSSQSLQAMAQELSGWFQSVRGDVAALSESARAAFDNRLGIDSTGPVTEIDAVKQALQGARDVLSKIGTDNLQVFDVTGVNRFKNSVLEAKNETVAAYSEQKLKALEYLDALQSGDGINQKFLTNAERSLSTMNLLGSQDLSTLRNALTAANNQLQQMSDSAAQAADNLQNELDNLQGNTGAIQQREYERQREELQAELERAKFYGNEEAIQSYQDALRTLEQVRQEQQKQNRAQSANSASSTTSASSGGVSSGNVASPRSVDVNLNLGGNKVTLQGDPSDVDAFLDYLEDYKNRSGA